ncbi:hypothetical protein SBV42_05235 [Chlamydia crocodili]|uniref:Inclusion membrane protein D n=2 Tax=Chlamydia crocodili TaxID=2766982 RepID=A0ABX8CF37_9CHLA|nr:hypothetical protein [Chlamydia crocodili]QVE49618.1 hypothetical protein H9Q19_00280 [Chlamydia crocodili]
MSTNIDRTVTPVQMSTQQIRTRCDNLTLEMNRVRVVPTCRLVIEIATAILGAACFALAVALATGLLIVSCSIWLVPTGFALGSALLTFAITSALLRQGELKLERSWRSHAMRWNYFANDLQHALKIAKHKRSAERDSSSSASVHSC